MPRPSDLLSHFTTVDVLLVKITYNSFLEFLPKFQLSTLHETGSRIRYFKMCTFCPMDIFLD